MLVWLSVWSKVQTCIWPSWCHCHSLSLASCFSKIQIGFTFLVPAHLGSPGKGPLNGCVCLLMLLAAISSSLPIVAFWLRHDYIECGCDVVCFARIAGHCIWRSGQIVISQSDVASYTSIIWQDCLYKYCVNRFFLLWIIVTHFSPVKYIVFSISLWIVYHPRI